MQFVIISYTPRAPTAYTHSTHMRTFLFCIITLLLLPSYCNCPVYSESCAESFFQPRRMPRPALVSFPGEGLCGTWNETNPAPPGPSPCHAWPAGVTGNSVARKFCRSILTQRPHFLGNSVALLHRDTLPRSTAEFDIGGGTRGHWGPVPPLMSREEAASYIGNAVAALK